MIKVTRRLVALSALCILALPTHASSSTKPHKATKAAAKIKPAPAKVKPGGANQLQAAVTGKIGDQLFDGRWRFKVLGVDTAPTYAFTTDGEPYNYHAVATWNSATRTLEAPAGNVLIIVHCEVANGQHSKQTLWIPDEGSNTAITDDQGQAYPSAGHDFSGAPVQSRPLIPGSKLRFPVVFCVPEGTKLKDLIFTLRNNDGGKGTDVRVSLKE